MGNKRGNTRGHESERARKREGTKARGHESREGTKAERARRQRAHKGLDTDSGIPYIVSASEHLAWPIILMCNLLSFSDQEALLFLGGITWAPDFDRFPHNSSKRPPSPYRTGLPILLGCQFFWAANSSGSAATPRRPAPPRLGPVPS